LRTHHEGWHKENLINIGVSRLPPDWKYVAWIDTDVRFARSDIVAETIHQLQHFSLVQMFAHATDLGPKYEPLKAFEGFVAQWMRDDQAPAAMKQYSLWHPGYAWACRRDAWDHLGGLIEFAIVGSADRYMACALIGEIARSLSPDLVRTWPDLCRMVLRLAGTSRDLHPAEHRLCRRTAAALLSWREEEARLHRPVGYPAGKPVRSRTRHQTRLAGRVAVD
jgi:hypothetical protein